jgi:hypothetical protein
VLAAAVGALHLGFLLLLGWMLRDPLQLVYGVPMALPAVLILPVLAAALTMLLLIVAVMSWKGSYWGSLARLHYTLIALASAVFVWQLHFWNLIGWNL